MRAEWAMGRDAVFSSYWPLRNVAYPTGRGVVLVSIMMALFFVNTAIPCCFVMSLTERRLGLMSGFMTSGSCSWCPLGSGICT